MTIKRTARTLAALALTLGGVWLWGVRASADSANYAAAGTDALVRELSDVIEVHSGLIAEGKGPDYHGKTVILHSNDTIGAVEGFPRMAWLKCEFERLGAETILADAGNFSMGSVYASTQGAAALELMNRRGGARQVRLELWLRRAETESASGGVPHPLRERRGNRRGDLRP